MSGDLPETLPPMRRYGQDYGPFSMDAEAGYERGGAYVEQGAADPGITTTTRLQFALYAGESGGGAAVLAHPGEIEYEFCDGYDALTAIPFTTSGSQTVWAQITIDTDTGSITARELVLSATDPTDAPSGVFATIVGSYEIAGGEVVSTYNNDYGPFFVVLAGGANEKWQAYIV